MLNCKRYASEEGKQGFNKGGDKTGELLPRLLLP